MKGRICIPYTVLSKITNTPFQHLTAREAELLGMLANGWSNTQIASRTGISENTVKYHLKNLYDKLEVRNRAMAVALYAKERRRKLGLSHLRVGPRLPDLPGHYPIGAALALPVRHSFLPERVLAERP